MLEDNENNQGRLYFIKGRGTSFVQHVPLQTIKCYVYDIQTHVTVLVSPNHATELLFL